MIVFTWGHAHAASLQTRVSFTSIDCEVSFGFCSITIHKWCTLKLFWSSLRFILLGRCRVGMDYGNPVHCCTTVGGVLGPNSIYWRYGFPPPLALAQEPIIFILEMWVESPNDGAICHNILCGQQVFVLDNVSALFLWPGLLTHCGPSIVKSGATRLARGFYVLYFLYYALGKDWLWPSVLWFGNGCGGIAWGKMKQCRAWSSVSWFKQLSSSWFQIPGVHKYHTRYGCHQVIPDDVGARKC